MRERCWETREMLLEWWSGWGEAWEWEEKAYRAKRLVVTTEKSMRRFTAEEQTDVRRNLAVPSPILRETDPILARFLTVRSS